MLARIKTWLAIAGGIVVALAIAFWRGQSAGRALEQARQATKDRRDAQTVANARAEARGQSDADLNKELDRWTRKN